MNIPENLIGRLEKIRFLVFDFDGVFTDNSVCVDQEGKESVRCSKTDSMGVARLRQLGVEMMVLSTEKNPVVSMRCQKMCLPCIQGVEEKVSLLGKIIAEKGFQWGDILFMGNDINDAGCLMRVGMPVVVADAHAEVIPLAQWVTKATGGNGAVREVCDVVAKISMRV